MSPAPSRRRPAVCSPTIPRRSGWRFPPGDVGAPAGAPQSRSSLLVVPIGVSPAGQRPVARRPQDRDARSVELEAVQARGRVLAARQFRVELLGDAPEGGRAAERDGAERPHGRPAPAQPLADQPVQVVGGDHAAVHQLDGLAQQGHLEAVEHEPGHVADRNRELADPAQDRGHPLGHGGIGAGGPRRSEVLGDAGQGDGGTGGGGGGDAHGVAGGGVLRGDGAAHQPGAEHGHPQPLGLGQAVTSRWRVPSSPKSTSWRPGSSGTGVISEPLATSGTAARRCSPSASRVAATAEETVPAPSATTSPSRRTTARTCGPDGRGSPNSIAPWRPKSASTSAILICQPGKRQSMISMQGSTAADPPSKRRPISASSLGATRLASRRVAPSRRHEASRTGAVNGRSVPNRACAAASPAPIFQATGRPPSASTVWYSSAATRSARSSVSSPRSSGAMVVPCRRASHSAAASGSSNSTSRLMTGSSSPLPPPRRSPAMLYRTPADGAPPPSAHGVAAAMSPSVASSSGRPPDAAAESEQPGSSERLGRLRAP